MRCIIKRPFPIDSEANLRDLNEDRRCHRRTKKPTSHSPRFCCLSARGALSAILSAPTLKETDHNLDLKLALYATYAKTGILSQTGVAYVHRQCHRMQKPLWRAWTGCSRNTKIRDWGSLRLPGPDHSDGCRGPLGRRNMTGLRRAKAGGGAGDDR